MVIPVCLVGLGDISFDASHDGLDTSLLLAVRLGAVGQSGSLSTS
jgi:hypothetical protein